MDVRDGQILVQCTNRDCQMAERPVSVGVVRIAHAVVTIPTPYCESCIYEGRPVVEMQMINWPPKPEPQKNFAGPGRPGPEDS